MIIILAIFVKIIFCQSFSKVSSKRKRLVVHSVPISLDNYASSSNIQPESQISEYIEAEAQTQQHKIDLLISNENQEISCKRKLNISDVQFEQPSKRRKTVLQQINESKVKNLSPKEKKLYFINREQNVRICKLKKALRVSKNKIKKAFELSKTQLFSDFNNKLDPIGIKFFKSSLENCKRKKPSWTTQNKIFSLALYKNGPRAYNFLRKCISLPSKSTIQQILSDLHFETGINDSVFSRFKEIVRKMPEIDRNCILMFDEIALTEKLTFDTVNDKIVGYVDCVVLNLRQIIKNNLVL